MLASSSLQLHRLCLSSSVSKPDSSVDTHYGSRNRTQRICQLPNVQGTSEASGVHGHPRALHHMGSLRCWRCHSWLHHCLLHLGIYCWSDCSCCFSLHWCWTFLLQTEERSAHKERRNSLSLRLRYANILDPWKNSKLSESHKNFEISITLNLYKEQFIAFWTHFLLEPFQYLIHDKGCCLSCVYRVRFHRFGSPLMPVG